MHEKKRPGQRTDNVRIKKQTKVAELEMGIEQNPNRTKTKFFSKTNRTERTRTVWQTEPEPNCQIGRTEPHTMLSERRARMLPKTLEKLRCFVH